MIKLYRSQGLNIRRNSILAGKPILRLAEAKVCDYTVGYGYLRGATNVLSGSVPVMENLYYLDTASWNTVWPGSYNWNDQMQSINYITDQSIHSHGDGSYTCQCGVQLSQFYRNYALPSGIINPPVKARLWLSRCGQAIYHYKPTAGPLTWVGEGTIGGVWGPSNGLELHFWSQTGTGTATYLLTHQAIHDKNVAAGNTLSVTGGVWPMWSGGILTDNLPGVPALFNQGNGVVCFRARWVWPGGERVSPVCDYCEGTSSYYSAPTTRIKYAIEPLLYVWG